MESLVVPELVPAPAAPQEPVESPRPGHDEAFWQRFGQALGMDLEGLDGAARGAGDQRRRFAAAVHRRLAAEPADPQRTEERTAPVAEHVARYRQESLALRADAGEALGHLLRMASLAS